MGKGSTKETTSSVELPPEITDAAKRNIALSNDVGAMPYMPNFAPQVAAFNPAQAAGYTGVQNMAGAFGMPTTGLTGREMGLPDAITNSDGTSGYSTKGLYDQAMAGLSPAMKAMLDQFHYNPVTGANPTNPNLKVSPISVPTPSGGVSTPSAPVQQRPTPVQPSAPRTERWSYHDRRSAGVKQCRSGLRLQNWAVL